MTKVLTDARERTRFLKFGVVGTIGAVVDFGVMNLLSGLFPVTLTLLGREITPLMWAGTISFVAAILSNFTWNRYWTYPDSRSKPLGHQLVQFSVISVMGLAIRIPILTFLDPALRQTFTRLPFSLPFSPQFLAKNVTLAIAVLIVMFWNFFVNRYVTYNDVK